MSALPPITDPLTIDGTTQPSDIVTTSLGPTQNGTSINITINGSKAGRVDGRYFTAKTTIRGERIINFRGGAGIFLGEGSDGSRIEGNIIGIDQNGQKQGNKYGVRISNSSDNWIGGWTKSVGESPGNVISGNTYGIYIQGKDAKRNHVFGNQIGDKEGKREVSNQTGVYIENAPENFIGGGEYSGNVISGNIACGIKIEGVYAKGNMVLANRIGTDKEGISNWTGVYIENAPENVIGGEWEGAGNVITNNMDGIKIGGKDAKGNKVLGNLIGTDREGNKKLGNSDSGVYIRNASENLIGDAKEGAGNVITNNWDGIKIEGWYAEGNKVLGNLIGSMESGNWIGVYIRSASENAIGGSNKWSRNYIFGNTTQGVWIWGGSAQKNKVQGNSIGIMPSSKIAENGGEGVLISPGASNNTIGGEEHSEGNRIWTKNKSGVVLGILGGTGNAILSNDIRIVEIKPGSRKKAIGIDLGDNGPTSNDKNDFNPFGPNNYQNYPILESVVLNGDNKLEIKGDLNSRPEKTYTIQFFKGECGSGKGELSYEYLFSESVETKTNSIAKIEFEKEIIGVEEGDFISATATDPDGNTSEFSECVPVEKE